MRCQWWAQRTLRLCTILVLFDEIGVRFLQVRDEVIGQRIRPGLPACVERLRLLLRCLGVRHLFYSFDARVRLVGA